MGPRPAPRPRLGEAAEEGQQEPRARRLRAWLARARVPLPTGGAERALDGGAVLPSVIAARCPVRKNTSRDRHETGHLCVRARQGARARACVSSKSYRRKVKGRTVRCTCVSVLSCSRPECSSLRSAPDPLSVRPWPQSCTLLAPLCPFLFSPTLPKCKRTMNIIRSFRFSQGCSKE